MPLSNDDLLTKLEKENEELLEFARDCHQNWDHDEDAHRYNTPCRSCEAEKLYLKYEKN